MTASAADPPSASASGPLRLRGISGSAGVAIGPAVVTGHSAARFKQRHIADHDVEGEILRFQSAVRQAKSGLRKVMQRASHLGAELTILEAYTLMLGDPILAEETERFIRVDRLCSEWAVARAIDGMARQISSSDDLYLRERGHDFQFVGDTIIRALRGERDEQTLLKLERPSIVVAHDLSPADTAAMVREPMIALMTEVGTRISHILIMARALDWASCLQRS